jgi:predicted ABC-type ATPase
MIDFAELDRRRIVVAIAGPNGAGKTTFYRAHLAPTGLRFVNADALAAELAADPYDAARLAKAVRRELVARSESFIFETVFSDPVGDKIDFLEKTARMGYTVVLCFIGLSGPKQSGQRVAMRVSQGGHDVPDEKLQSRFPRTLANLKNAIRRLPCVVVYDNSDLRRPYRLIAVFKNGQAVHLEDPVPKWFRRCISDRRHR